VLPENSRSFLSCCWKSMSFPRRVLADLGRDHSSELLLRLPSQAQAQRSKSKINSNLQSERFAVHGCMQLSRSTGRKRCGLSSSCSGVDLFGCLVLWTSIGGGTGGPHGPRPLHFYFWGVWPLHFFA